MKILINNATIVNEGKSIKSNVLIENDIIKEITSAQIKENTDQVIEADGLILIPGVIDDQVHFRQPGLTHKADIATESIAAVAGGVTSFMEMPNTNPQSVTNDLLEEKYKVASEVSPANYSFYIGATNENIDEVLKADPKKVCGIKCFMGSSTGNMLVEGQGLITLFKNAHMLVATHCEEEAIIRKNTEIYKNRYGENVPIECHPLIRSEEACYRSSSKAVELAEQYNTRLHILHLTTAKEMGLFTKGSLSTKRITNEVCVHHLWFSDIDYKTYGNRIKWNPAVKTTNDRTALREALNNDIIDVVATDHAPHTIQEKKNTYFKAPSGGPLVQHSLQSMLEMAKKDIFTIEKVVEKMCHAPAKLFNIEKRGFIKEGYKADLVLINPKKDYTVLPDNTLYKCKWSPFDEFTFTNTIEKTFVNGNIVFDNQKVNNNFKGERLTFNR